MTRFITIDHGKGPSNLTSTSRSHFIATHFLTIHKTAEDDERGLVSRSGLAIQHEEPRFDPPLFSTLKLWSTDTVQ